MNVLCESLEPRALFSGVPIAEQVVANVVGDLGAIQSDYAAAVGRQRADLNVITDQILVASRDKAIRKDVLLVKRSLSAAIAIESVDLAKLMKQTDASAKQIRAFELATYKKAQASDVPLIRAGSALENHPAPLENKLVNDISAGNAKITAALNTYLAAEFPDVDLGYLAASNFTADLGAMPQTVQADLNTLNSDISQIAFSLIEVQIFGIPAQ